MKKRNGLTKRQLAFIDEYLLCWNAAEAARRAGYSKRTAKYIGYENLTKPHLREEIDKRIAERAMTADEALDRLGEHAKGNLGYFMEFVGGVRQPYLNIEQAKDKLHLIKKMKQDAAGRIEIELYDAQSALTTILKAHGTFVDRSQVEHSVKDETLRSIDDMLEKIYGNRDDDTEPTA